MDCKTFWPFWASFICLIFFVSCSADEKGRSAYEIAIHQKHTVYSPQLVPTTARVCSVEKVYVSPTREKVVYGGVVIPLSCVFNSNSQTCLDDKSRHAPSKTYQYNRKRIHISFLDRGERPVFFDINGNTSGENELILKSGQYNIYASNRRSQHKYIYTGTIIETTNIRVKKKSFEAKIAKLYKEKDIGNNKRTKLFNHFFLNQNYLGTIISDYSTGALFYLNSHNGNFAEIPINGYSIKSYNLVKTKSGTRILIADGMPILLNGNVNPDEWIFNIKDKQYPRVIFDRTLGEVIGFTSIDSDIYLDPTVPKLDADWIKDTIDKFRIQHRSSILNRIQFSSRSSVLIIDAYDNRVNEVRLITQKDSGAIVCKNRAPIIIDEEIELDRSDELATINGPLEAPVYSLKISNNLKNKKNLIVYLRGGPNSSVFSWKTATLKKIYPLERNEIVVFDYSGSLGSSVSNVKRLSLKAESSLQSDIFIISDYLRGLDHEQYDQVIIHSESLSGLIAMELASMNKDIIDKLVLIAPWTHYLNSKDLKPFFNSQNSLKKQRQSYNSFNKAIFRIDDNKQSDNFRDWMEQVRDNFTFDGKVMVFQAEHENRVPLETAQKYFESFRNVNHTIIKGQFHETLSKHPDIKNEIQNLISSP